MKHLTLVIGLIGTIGGLAVLGIIALAVLEHPVPGILEVVAGSALTGLAGVLARPAETAGDLTTPG